MLDIPSLNQFLAYQKITARTKEKTTHPEAESKPTTTGANGGCDSGNKLAGMEGSPPDEEESLESFEALTYRTLDLQKAQLRGNPPPPPGNTEQKTPKKSRRGTKSKKEADDEDTGK